MLCMVMVLVTHQVSSLVSGFVPDMWQDAVGPAGQGNAHIPLPDFHVSRSRGTLPNVISFFVSPALCHSWKTIQYRHADI